MSSTAAAFVRESATFLRDVYLPRMRRALDALPEGDLWWRPHDGVLSFGTILLHLEGNVRQWIVSGLGGAADHRDRASEFAATDGPGGDELFARLDTTVREACEVIEGLDDASVGRTPHARPKTDTGERAAGRRRDHEHRFSPGASTPCRRIPESFHAPLREEPPITI